MHDRSSALAGARGLPQHRCGDDRQPPPGLPAPGDLGADRHLPATNGDALAALSPGHHDGGAQCCLEADGRLSAAALPLQVASAQMPCTRSRTDARASSSVSYWSQRSHGLAAGRQLAADPGLPAAPRRPRRRRGIHAHRGRAGAGDRAAGSGRRLRAREQDHSTGRSASPAEQRSARESAPRRAAPGRFRHSRNNGPAEACERPTQVGTGTSAVPFGQEGAGGAAICPTRVVDSSVRRSASPHEGCSRARTGTRRCRSSGRPAAAPQPGG